MRTRPIALVAIALCMLLAPAAYAQGDTVTVAIVHGIPGVTVDVYVNGDLTLEGFEPGAITDPLALPAGSYGIEIFATGADPDSEDPVATRSVDLLGAGTNWSIVAFLRGDGTPTVGWFFNDTSTLAAGDARFTARHTAGVDDEFDFLVNGEPQFTGISNGEPEFEIDLPAGRIELTVARRGETDPLIGPVELEFAEGVNTIVYAVGSAEDETLDLLVQTISGLHEAPSGVESGVGGLKAAEQRRAAQLPLVFALASVVFLGIGAGVRRVARSRHSDFDN